MKARFSIKFRSMPSKLYNFDVLAYSGSSLSFNLVNLGMVFASKKTSLQEFARNVVENHARVIMPFTKLFPVMFNLFIMFKRNQINILWK